MPNTLPLLYSSLAVLLSAGNVCSRISEETGGLRPSDLNFGSRRRAGVSANFLLQIVAGKLTAACCLFFSEGGVLFPHPADFLSQAP